MPPPFIHIIYHSPISPIPIHKFNTDINKTIIHYIFKFIQLILFTKYTQIKM